jgi:hypothetical protein
MEILYGSLDVLEVVVNASLLDESALAWRD